VGLAADAFGEETSPLDLHGAERRLIVQSLAATNGNVPAGAKKLGISGRMLHGKISEMNLAKAPGKTTDASGTK
jgi:DNA-binding NtrC family response regulator